MDSKLNALSFSVILGAAEIGILLSCTLFGCLVIQTYIYGESTKDPFWLKGLVAWCFILETLHSAFLMYYFYDLTVINYGTLTAILGFPWYLAISIPLHGAIVASVQAFFTYRVYVVSKKLWLALPCWIAETLYVAVATYVSYVAITTKTQLAFVLDYNWAIIFILVNAALVDWANCLLLCYYLRSRYTGIKKTKVMINKIVIFSIEIGLSTSIFSILLAILAIVQSSIGLVLGVYISYTKLHSNSLLVSLNSRERFRNNCPTTSHGRDVITIGSAGRLGGRCNEIVVDVETVQNDETGQKFEYPLQSRNDFSLQPLTPAAVMRDKMSQSSAEMV